MKKHISYSSQKKKNFEDEISVLKIYASNTRAFTVVKETRTKSQITIKPHTVIVGDFITLLSPLDWTARQKQQRNKGINRSYDSNRFNRHI